MNRNEEPIEVSDHSVTLLIHQLKQQDPDAAREIWQRYFERLIPLAKAKLNTFSQHQDEEDILLSVFDRFFQAAGSNRFRKLDDRDDLWRLLLMLTDHKVTDEYRKTQAQKRGGGKVRNASDVSDFDINQVKQIAERDPTPEYLVSFNETLARALQRLDAGGTREVAILRLEGYQNREIAEQLGVSLASVERKLRVIREVWEEEFRESAS